MSPTEQVARWLHKTFKKVRPGEFEGFTGSWERVTEHSKETYRLMAAELLTNPPAALVEALRARIGTGCASTAEKEAASG